LARHFLNGLIGGYAGMVLMGPRVAKEASVPGSKSNDLVSLVIIQGLLAGGLTLAFDWWVYPALWLAPLASVTVLFHLVRSFAEHAITDSEAPRHSNRLITISSNLLERGWVSPYGMNYHAEHHLIPSVPAPRLKGLQKRLSERDDLPPVLVRRSYGRALWDYARSLRD
jgi:fatty acid desaturase